MSDNDFAQLAAWRTYRETNLSARVKWTVVVCFQAKNTRLQRTTVAVQAANAGDASRIALSRYQKLYPRREGIWAESAKQDE